MAHTENISEFFRDRHVFITGGSGYLGKVLIEKLLRSCPTIGTLYLLVRPKNGRKIEERLKKITECPLFDRIKSEGNAHLLRKITGVSGDVSDIKLGLSENDENVLIENVSVIFHAAASIRFDDSLKDAILTNTRGTREVVNLALRMKNNPILAHISTAYSNCDHLCIEERLYPPTTDWRKTIEVAEKTDRYTLDTLTDKYIGDFPNTYTFAKHLAEHVVRDTCQDKIPAFILRPSVVTAAFQEPFEGWCDSYAGSCGVAAGINLGLIRSFYGNPDIYVDNVPVDLCIKAAIIGVWVKSTESNKKELLVCNASGILLEKLGKYFEMMTNYGRQHPSDRQLWFPSAYPTSSRLLYTFSILLQLILSSAMDLVLYMSGKKTLVATLVRKIHAGNMALIFFTWNDFFIINKNFLELENRLHPDDQASFTYDLKNYDTDTFIGKAMNSGRMYLLREKPKSLAEDVRKSRTKASTHYATCAVTYSALFWTAFVKLNFLGLALAAAYKYWPTI